MTTAIGERLRLIRGDLGHTQKNMSDVLGLGIRTWQTYELGKSLPKAETLNQLSGLGYSIDWVLTGRGSMHPGGMADEAASYSPMPIDRELMGRVTDAIVRLYRSENASLSPIDQGRLAAELYCEVKLVTEPAERAGALSYLIEVKRRELRAVGERSRR